MYYLPKREMLKVLFLFLLAGEGLCFSNWRTWTNGFQDFQQDLQDGFEDMAGDIAETSKDMFSHTNNYLNTLPDMLDAVNMPDFSSLGSEIYRRVPLPNIADLSSLGPEISRRIPNIADLSSLGPEISRRMPNMDDFSKIVPAISRSMPDMNYDFSSIGPAISSSIPKIDYDFWTRLGDPSDPSFWQKFGVPGNPWRKLRPWWEGDNVCVNKEILEPEDLQSMSVTGSIDAMVKMSKCELTEDVYTCEQLAYINGEKKGIKTAFSCCHGYKVVSEGYEKHCKEVDIRPTEETIADLEGTDFLAMFSEENLVDSLSNSTVFMPDNEAIQAFVKGLSDMSPLPEDNVAISYTVDDGLMKRRKRQIDLIVDQEIATKDILLGHLAPQILNIQDFSDNQLISTKSTGGATIRMSVYPTHPVKIVLANCALITSKNHHTTTGVVHVVDKVIQPASQTIGEILSEDTQFRTFMSNLDQKESEKLFSDKETLTVFAPSETAFQNLDEETSAKVFGPGSCGNHILRSHILPEIVCSGAIMGRAQATNTLGDELMLRRDDNGDIFVNDIKLVMKDMVATNGVIHVIESIIVPESSNTVEEEIKGRKADKFAELIEASKLWEKLNALKNFTLLLPSKQAMNEIEPEMLEVLKQDPKQLEELVLHHVIPKKYHQCSKMDKIVKSLSGRPHHTNFPHTVSCARIEPTAKVCGGNVYTVDRLLTQSMTGLLDTLEKSQEHTTFFKLIKDLNLSLNGVHTIFAPTNQAFQQLQAETQHKIFGDKEMMRKVVENHIVPSAVCCASAPRNLFAFKQFARGERTLGGQTLFLRRSHTGHVLVNSEASVERCDIIADDGIIHSVDSVIMPRELTVPPMRNFQFWEF